MNKVRRSVLMISAVVALSLMLVGSAFASTRVPNRLCGRIIGGVVYTFPCT